MTTRMTGITGLLDTDALVSASMLPYKTKVNTKKQDKQIMQWKQQQYRQIMKDSKSFYDKYLDTTGTNSLSLLSKYTTAKFTSNNENAVTATASNGAVVDNYTVSVTQLAAKATASLDTVASGAQTIKIGNSNIEIDFVADATDGTKTVTNYNNAVSTKISDLNAIVNDAAKTADEKTAAKAQISDLNSVKATYSSFSNSVAFNATQMGLSGYQADNTTPNASFTLNKGTANEKIATDIQAKATITNSKNQVINYVGNSNTTVVDGITFNFKTPTVGNSTSNLTDLIDVPSLTSLADVPIDGTTTSVPYQTTGTVKTTTSADGTKTTIKTTAADGKITTTTTSTNGTKTTTAADGTITTTSADGRKTIISADGTTTTTTSADGRKTISSVAGSTTTSADGTKTVTLANGDTTTTSADGTKTTATTGGVTKTTVQNTVSLTGTTDITDMKKNIVSFVNDYNTLMSSINTKIYETYDKSYKPLTDDQKTSMKDTDITNWQTKAQTGLLRNDDNLEELASSMKDAMSTFMSSTGLSLEQIGIKPVDDYQDKNGTLTIDDAKLTTALEQNFDGVKDLFTNGILTSDTTNGGVITKLKSSIYSNTMASTANLVQKAGNDTGLSSLTNEMTLQLNDMTKNITEMESSLTDRENTLYTKYASIESTLSKLQAQQSSLDSYFTSGS